MRDASRLHIGVAGEFRVMSELFLRGFNPAKSYLDRGVDIILEGGKTIQVKTARRYVNKCGKREKPTGRYQFSFQDWENRKHTLGVNFVICWAIEDNIFFIIPHEDVPSRLSYAPAYKKNRMEKYINNWAILES
jgi:hypothetical protein